MPSKWSGFIERFLFSLPRMYAFKRWFIEVFIWRYIMSGMLRMKLNPMPSIDGCFAGKRVLLGACGPGDATTGPSIDAASQILSFDISANFAQRCLANRPGWFVFQADALHIPLPDGASDVTVLYSALHHIPTPAQHVLAELQRVSNGCLVIVEGVVPASGILRRALLLWYKIVDGGANYYTRQELTGVFDSMGLHPEYVDFHGPLRHMMLAVLHKASPAPQ